MQRLSLFCVPRVVFAAAVLSLGACAAPNAPPARTSDGGLTNPAGMTLYTFDRDAANSGRSVCNGPCGVNWPAFTPGSTTTAPDDWAIITRDDGSKQWAFKGKPLYTFAKDAKPGDKTGDGFNNAWHVARP